MVDFTEISKERDVAVGLARLCPPGRILGTQTFRAAGVVRILPTHTFRVTGVLQFTYTHFSSSQGVTHTFGAILNRN